jgi:uncharacterized protein YycO
LTGCDYPEAKLKVWLSASFVTAHDHYDWVSSMLADGRIVESLLFSGLKPDLDDAKRSGKPG